MLLPQTDAATGADAGGVGAILRREGLYSSSLTDWRRLRDAGAFAALAPVRRGPKATAANPLAAKVALLQQDNARLTQRLTQAEAIIDIQKKLQRCWGYHWHPAAAGLDQRGRGPRSGQRRDGRGLSGTRDFARPCSASVPGSSRRHVSSAHARHRPERSQSTNSKRC